jgi:hypothetical protein
MWAVGRDRARRFALLSVLVFVGCSDSATGPEDDGDGAAFLVDASNDTAFVALGSAVSLVTVGDFTASSAWDLGFYQTAVLVNGPGVGPGGVTVHCVCQNAGATPEQIYAMTPDAELADFESVTAANIPGAASAWSATTFTTDPWYLYNIDEHVIYPTFQVYLVKKGSVVHKVQFTGYYGPAGDSRQITIRHEVLAG